MRLQLEAIDENAMVAIGKQLGAAMNGQALVFLEGQLGAGKTTLSRGVLRAFGHQGHVKSPTYTLVEPYSFGEKMVYHFDLYRLADAEELEYMGIRDYFSPGNFCLVEWPERGAGILPEPDMVVTILAAGNSRSIELSAQTAIGERILAIMNNYDARAKQGS